MVNTRARTATPTPSVYSCCNSAGIFPHSYGNVLGLIERSQLGFGVRRKWYTSKYLCSNGKPSITTELASHDINFTPNRAKNVLLPPKLHYHQQKTQEKCEDDEFYAKQKP